MKVSHCGVIPKPDFTGQRKKILSCINGSKEEFGPVSTKGRRAACLLLQEPKNLLEGCWFAGYSTGRNLIYESESSIKDLNYGSK